MDVDTALVNIEAFVLVTGFLFAVLVAVKAIRRLYAGRPRPPGFDVLPPNHRGEG